MVCVVELTAKASSVLRVAVRLCPTSTEDLPFTESARETGVGMMTELRMLTIQSNTRMEITDEDGVHDANWIPGTRGELVYLKSGDQGITRAIIANESEVRWEPYLTTTLNAPVGNLEWRTLGDGVAFAITGLIGPDWRFYNETVAEKQSTARVFYWLAIRFWNEMHRAERFTLWYNKLIRRGGKWSLSL